VGFVKKKKNKRGEKKDQGTKTRYRFSLGKLKRGSDWAPSNKLGVINSVKNPKMTGRGFWGVVH